MKKQILFLLTWLSCMSFIYAQPTSGFNYQASIRTAAGIPIPRKQVSVRFSVHDVSATGTIVYQEKQTSLITNEAGIMNAVSGKGTPSVGLFSRISWNDGIAKYLPVEVDTCGCPPSSSYVDLGTTQFNSVAYASFAATSGNGLPAGSALGEMMFFNGESWIKLPPGVSGDLMTMCNGVPTWGGCPSKPVVITRPLSSVMGTTFANGGGTVMSDGGATVTVRGVCWSEYSNPTIDHCINKTVNGSGSGGFNSAITGLNSRTTYHVRAYATNSKGTSYGADIIFGTR